MSKMSKLLKASVVTCAAVALSVNAPASERVLSRFEGGQITALDLQAAIDNKDADTRRRLATPEGRMHLLGELVDYALLVLEAKRRGYRAHPRVLEATRHAAVEAMLAAELMVDPASIPAADVARELETQRARAALPKMRANDPLRADAEEALRDELAKQRFEQAKNQLVKRLYEQHQPKVHTELLDAIALEPAALSDQPRGFPAAPPDPRAAARSVEPDGV